MHTMMYYGYGYGPMMGFGGLLGFLWNLLAIVALIWLVLFLVRRGGPRKWHMYEQWQSHSALGILNERFAKGEIDKAEYEERKRALLGLEEKMGQ